MERLVSQVKKGFFLFYFLFCQIGATEELSLVLNRNHSLMDIQQRQLLTLLKEYAEVFSELRGLPPAHSYNHAINLVPNQGPISVRP